MMQVWMCPFCMGRNHFPPHYQGISETNLPAELYPSYCTIEYTLPKTVQPHPPTYLFLIDTCVSEDELNACKTAILQVCAPQHSSGTVHHYTELHARATWSSLVHMSDASHHPIP